MSPGKGGQGEEQVLTPCWTMLLFSNSADNILQVKLDNRQSPLHTPPAGGGGNPKLSLGLMNFDLPH